MTFSIAARTGDASLFGIAIASSSPAVAARCVHMRAGIGAVATQNITDPSLGRTILDALGQQKSGQAALEMALCATPYAPYRQLIVIGPSQAPVVHSGAHTLGIHATAVGEHAACAGNLLANPQVPLTILAAFEQASGPFGLRLLQALRAGQARGGEAGPIRSAGLMIVREVPWPIVDLRVDWDERDPIDALVRLWAIYAPQIDDYVNRALNPAGAASFGVPGDP